MQGALNNLAIVSAAILAVNGRCRLKDSSAGLWGPKAPEPRFVAGRLPRFRSAALVSTRNTGRQSVVDVGATALDDQGALGGIAGFEDGRDRRRRAGGNLQQCRG